MPPRKPKVKYPKQKTLLGGYANVLPLEYRNIEWWGKHPKDLLCCHVNGEYKCSCCGYKYCRLCVLKLLNQVEVGGCFIYEGDLGECMKAGNRAICSCCEWPDRKKVNLWYRKHGKPIPIEDEEDLYLI